MHPVLPSPRRPARAPRPARTRTINPKRPSNGQRTGPGIFAFECLVKIKHVGELLSRVRGLAHEQTQLNQREDDVADVGAGPDSPVFQYDSRHDAKPIQGQIAAGQRELPAGDVAAFVEALLAVLEGGQNEQVRAFVEPRLPEPDTVHYSVAKCQFGHCSPRCVWSACRTRKLTAGPNIAPPTWGK